MTTKECDRKIDELQSKSGFGPNCQKCATCVHAKMEDDVAYCNARDGIWHNGCLIEYYDYRGIRSDPDPEITDSSDCTIYKPNTFGNKLYNKYSNMNKIGKNLIPIPIPICILLGMLIILIILLILMTTSFSSVDSLGLSNSYDYDMYYRPSSDKSSSGSTGASQWGGTVIRYLNPVTRQLSFGSY